MLKVRIIPLLILESGLIKKPVCFKNSRTIANPFSIIRVFEERQVDELILLRRGEFQKNEKNEELCKKISKELTVPFAIGGGIKTTQTAREFIKAGAEKIVINTAAFSEKSLISQLSQIFGKQAVVVSVDAIKKNNMYFACIKDGAQQTSIAIERHLENIQIQGAGEVLINSVPHDGKMLGLNIDLIKKTKALVSVPLIAAGGAGQPSHFLEAVQAGASAVAAGSIFHFTKTTPQMIKCFLHKFGVPVRN